MLRQWMWRQSVLPCSPKNDERIIEIFEAACWLDVFTQRNQLVWRHLKVTILNAFFQWNSGLKTLFPVARPGTQAKNASCIPHSRMAKTGKEKQVKKKLNAAFESGAAVSRGPSQLVS